MKASVLLLLCCVGFAARAEEPIARCEVRWFEQPLDHFTWPTQTFLQRYFVCARDSWTPGKNAPLFFYTGNEADVTLYLNHTGLMWEAQPLFKALLVFAEHRYFGQSLPPKSDDLRYLSSAQALEDHAALIRELRSSLVGENAPVIAFGGSYGGMLSAWLRMKHPEAVDGAIAASAPVLAFLGENPAYDLGGYAAIETADAGTACASLVRSAWAEIAALSGSVAGRTELARRLRLCKVPETRDAAMVARDWAADAIGYLAMGQLPYASSYMSNGRCVLPAWPLSVGCRNAATFANSSAIDALREVVDPWFNCSHDLACFSLEQTINNETLRVAELWDWLACTELLMPDSTDGVRDMFWDAPFSLNEYSDACFARNKVRPRPYEAATRYGGLKAIKAATNIVFSNGELDPWRAGGVVEGTAGLPKSIATLTVAKGAHHLDLMFSNPDDPQSVKDVRKTEHAHIATWIQQASLRQI